MCMIMGSHYINLVGGRFERTLIIHVVDEKKRKDEMVMIGKQARSQLV